MSGTLKDQPLFQAEAKEAEHLLDVEEKELKSKIPAMLKGAKDMFQPTQLFKDYLVTGSVETKEKARKALNGLRLFVKNM